MIRFIICWCFPKKMIMYFVRLTIWVSNNLEITNENTNEIMPSAIPEIKFIEPITRITERYRRALNMLIMSDLIMKYNL